MEPWMVRDSQDSEPREMTVEEMRAEIERLEKMSLAGRIELDETLAKIQAACCARA